MVFEELRDNYALLKARGETLVKSYLGSGASEKLEGIEETMVKATDFWSMTNSTALMKEKANIEGYINDTHTINNIIDDTDAAWELYHEGEKEFIDDIQAYYRELLNIVDAFEVKLILNGKYDANSAIITLHSGAGGTEADDWCAMLARMYLRWADRRGLVWTVLNTEAGEAVGYKSITARVHGEFAYGLLRSEIGVHRLVRISPFDSSSRRHTSFASVSVLPEIDDVELEIQINPTDLRIDTFRASGAGGQHVNTTDSAVRITHTTTGIVASCQSDRSQHKNKAAAMKIIVAKLFEHQQQEKQELHDKLEGTKADIGWGNQIRSYVMQPYRMVKDLRTRVETGNIDSVMDGDIDIFIKEFLLHMWNSRK